MTLLFVVINQKTWFILLQELFNHILIKSIKNNSTVWRVTKFFICFAKKFKDWQGTVQPSFYRTATNFSPKRTKYKFHFTSLVSGVS